MDNWSNDLVLEFIQLYESYPVIWDPQHKHHKNRNSLFDAWQNIAQKFSGNVAVETLKKKKELLMATYRTLAKKVRCSHTTGSGTSDVYEPTWFAFHAIDRFIRPTGKKNPSLCSEEWLNEDFSKDETSQNEVAVTTDADNVERDENEVVFSPTNQHSVEVVTEKPGGANFIMPQVAPRKNRGRGGATPVEANIERHLKQATEVLTSITSNNNQTTTKNPPDEADLYGQLLAAKLRRLPKRKRLILQNQIDNMVFEAELNNEFNNNYYSCATTPPNAQTSSSSTPVPSPQAEIVEYFTFDSNNT